MAHPLTYRAALLVAVPSLAPLLVSAVAQAQDPPTGQPPPDATALVAAPADTAKAPTFDKPTDGTNATLSAGGQLVTGNSRLLALTMNGNVESRFGMNGIGVSVLGNYGQGAAP